MWSWKNKEKDLKQKELQRDIRDLENIIHQYNFRLTKIQQELKETKEELVTAKAVLEENTEIFRAFVDYFEEILKNDKI